MIDIKQQSNPPPIQNVDQNLLEWVRELIEDHRVSLDDNFLDVGGNSLMAVILNERLQNVYGVHVPMKKLFQLSLGEAFEHVRTAESALNENRS